MRLLIGVVFVVSISISTPATADCASPNDVLSFSGLGDGGDACGGRSLSSDNISERISLYTGWNPERTIEVTIDTHAVMTPRNDGTGKSPHAICFAMLAKTMPWYADGLPTPDPPFVMLDQSADDNGIVVYESSNATIRIRAIPSQEGFQPNANYSLNIVCPTRPWP